MRLSAWLAGVVVFLMLVAGACIGAGVVGFAEFTPHYRSENLSILTGILMS